MKLFISLVRRNFLSLIIFNSVVFLLTVFSIIYSEKTAQPIWTAEAKFNLPDSKNDLETQLGTLGTLKQGNLDFSKELNPLALQVSILKSDSVLATVYQQDPEREFFANINNFKTLFDALPLDESSVLLVRARGRSTQMAKERLSTFIASYQQRLNQLRTQYTRQRLQFYQKQIIQAEQKLVGSQANLMQFQNATGLVDADSQTEHIVKAIIDSEAQLSKTKYENEAKKTQISAATNTLGMTPETIENSLQLAEDSEYQKFRDLIAEVDADLSNARATFNDDHPQVQELYSKRELLQSQLRSHLTKVIPVIDEQNINFSLKGGGADSRIDAINSLTELRRESAGLTSQANELAKQIDILKIKRQIINVNRTRSNNLMRQVEVSESTYKAVLALIEQAKTDPFNAYPDVQILDSPTVNTTPIQPKHWLTMIGGLLASIFGSAALLLLSESRQPLLRSADLEKLDKQILTCIPHHNSDFLMNPLTIDIGIEFQQLASMVLSLNLQNNRLIITSAVSGEGKSSTTLGLALALVNFGFRVLIVDGDLRKRSLSLCFANENSTNSSEIYPPIPISLLTDLDLLVAPLLMVERMASFCTKGHFENYLNLVQENGSYDYILVDSSPSAQSIESELMSKIVQNVLFVVRDGESDRNSVFRSLEQLSQLQVIGIVMNDVNDQSHLSYINKNYGHKEQFQGSSLVASHNV